MNATDAANERFNKWLEENTGMFEPPLGYGEFDREDLDMPNQLDNPDDEVVDYSKYFAK